MGDMAATAASQHKTYVEEMRRLLPAFGEVISDAGNQLSALFIIHIIFSNLSVATVLL